MTSRFASCALAGLRALAIGSRVAERRAVRTLRLGSYLAFLGIFASCAGNGTTGATTSSPGGDSPIGDPPQLDDKADGGSDGWGSALDCKPVPVLPQLQHAHIVLSIDGQTAHLMGDGYDKVFPVGDGAIVTDETDPNYGESNSYPPIANGRHDFEITPGSIQECKTWWTDPETGAQSPVFAGLPFLSWDGDYAMHGPIDNYTAPNGGTLRRGYVSHGCFRMEAADILEVYGRIKGIAHVPVHVQREPERRADGSRVDVANVWVGAACDADSDCTYSGGYCAKDAYAGHGFCSMHCTQYCSDRANLPSTFCVADPNNANQGMCVPKALSTNYECRPYDGMSVAAQTPRFHQPAVTADVCLPGSKGWVGDHCFTDSECGNGTTCLGATATDPGICSESCAKYCPDEVGFPETLCANAPELSSSGTCLRQCTPSENGAECPSDMSCGTVSRWNSTVQKTVCLPKN